MVSIYLGSAGMLDDVAVEHVLDFAREFLIWLKANQAHLLAVIDESGDFTEDIAEQVLSAIKAYKKQQSED